MKYLKDNYLFFRNYLLKIIIFINYNILILIINIYYILKYESFDNIFFIIIIIYCKQIKLKST